MVNRENSLWIVNQYKFLFDGECFDASTLCVSRRLHQDKNGRKMVVDLYTPGEKKRIFVGEPGEKKTVTKVVKMVGKKTLIRKLGRYSTTVFCKGRRIVYCSSTVPITSPSDEMKKRDRNRE